MSLTTDPNDPDIKGGSADTEPVPQNKKYLVLPEAERAKGFVRPLRDTYVHVGDFPKHPLRDLTEEEREKLAEIGNNKGCMSLKGGMPEHTGETQPDRWALTAR